MLGDFGAEVIKVEHPRRPDPSRGHGPAKDGVGLWWKLLGRNKRTLTLDLSTPRRPGRAAAAGRRRRRDHRELPARHPGDAGAWAGRSCRAVNPRLVLARVTGFGQFGPYAHRPGFGTLAEAMSGFAAITGEPDGPPTLPPFGLADSIAALATAYAVMTALAGRDAPARGQVVDMAIIEPILDRAGPAAALVRPARLRPAAHRQPLRATTPRATPTAPRTAQWVAVSTSAQSVAERVMRLVGRPELIDEPWFATGTGRAEHADELDEAVGDWIARRTRDEVVAAFEKAEAAVAPDLRRPGRDGGPAVPGAGHGHRGRGPRTGPAADAERPLPALRRPRAPSAGPGRPHGADTDEVLAELGLSARPRSRALRDEGAL